VNPSASPSSQPSNPSPSPSSQPSNPSPSASPQPGAAACTSTCAYLSVPCECVS
jgi:hypothetical protein